MPFQDELKRWHEELSIAFGDLSAPQIYVLTLYSFGMILTYQCGQTIVSVFLAQLLGKKASTVRQQLREWTYEKEQKRGQQRCEIAVSRLFAPLLKWVLQQWCGCKRLTLALDVTYLKDRWMILCISVLYGQTAIPVAWQVLPFAQPGAWTPLWQELVARLAPCIPRTVVVYVLCDRGLYSKTLFITLRSKGWHVFMRIRAQGLFHHFRHRQWRSLATLAFQGMRPYALRATCFKGDPLVCVLWVRWEVGAAEPCLVVSDLLPQQVQGNPYPLRMWIEMGFKQWKRGGFHWEHCKIHVAQRMERLLLVIALAHLYLVRQAHTEQDTLTCQTDPAQRLGLATLGWVRLLARLLNGAEASNESYFRPYSFPPFFPRKKTYP